MKFFLLVAFVALCSASTLYPNRNILFNDDGTVLISGTTGRRFIINKQFGLNGQKDIDIVITDRYNQMKRVQINDQFCRVIDHTGTVNFNDVHDNTNGLKLHDKYQVDVLYDILGEYQGDVDDARYVTLLRTIDNHVKKGQICQVVYDLLNCLDNLVDDDVLNRKVMQYQHVVNKGLYGGQFWDNTRDYFGGQLKRGWYGNRVLGNDYNMDDTTRIGGGLYGINHYYNQLFNRGYYGDNQLFNRGYYGDDYLGHNGVSDTRAEVQGSAVHNVLYDKYKTRGFLGKDRTYLRDYLQGVHSPIDTGFMDTLTRGGYGQRYGGYYGGNKGYGHGIGGYGGYGDYNRYGGYGDYNRYGGYGGYGRYGYEHKVNY